MSQENIFAKGKLFELVQTTQPDGRVFEVARRAPGVRIIIHDKTQGKVLLTKEFRSELNGWDFRLPGGKVFDSLDEYEAHRTSGEDIVVVAEAKAKAESIEETGIVLNGLRLVRKSTLGATVEWDLYIFESDNWEMHELGQQLEHGEQIEAENWFTYAEVEDKILSGEMQEDRIALVLLQWTHQQQKGQS